MVQVYVTSAFSKDGSGGNKAGVVINRPDLSREQKMAIAKELGYSETAFILPCDDADFELQYFTPTDEVPLCGHATIASFATMQLLGMLEKEDYTIRTKAGILSIKVNDGLIFMEQNRPEYFDILPPRLFADCFAVGANERLPIQTVSTGLKDIIFPVASRVELEALEPDFGNMTRLSRELDVVGIHAFTLSDKSGMDAECRNFAPLYGIDEESATGTASCALACYLYKHCGKKEEYVFEQGHTMGLPSQIFVKLSCKGDEVEAVYVGGRGYLVCEKTLTGIDTVDSVARIEKMEQYFVAARNTGDEDALKHLSDYMDSGLWLKDYELDEKGLLPKELKRGVLSQDGLYNLLSERGKAHERRDG